jgi:AGZA family xanthine/uracil permease-like MFS transporter
MTVVCLTGTVSLISAVVPLEAGIAIVLWIGVVITAQAFQASPNRHAPAAAIGLFPAIVAWGVAVVMGAFTEANRNPNDYSLRFIAAQDSTAAAQVTESQPTTTQATEPMRLAATTMQDLIESKHEKLGFNTKVNGFWLHGMCILERGYIFTCMLIAAISAFLIDRRFFPAAGWALAGAILTILGLMHAYQLKGNELDYLLAFAKEAPGAFAYRAYPVVIGYLLMAGVFLAIGRRDANQTVEKIHDPLEDARVTIPDEVVHDDDSSSIPAE